MLQFSLGRKLSSFRKLADMSDMKDDLLSSDNPRKEIFASTSVRIFCMDNGRLFMCCQNPLRGEGRKSV